MRQTRQDSPSRPQTFSREEIARFREAITDVGAVDVLAESAVSVWAATVGASLANREYACDLAQTCAKASLRAVHAHAGSEIEKLFLGTLVLLGVRTSGIGIQVTDPMEDAPTQIAERRAELQFVMYWQRELGAPPGPASSPEAGARGPHSFLDHVAEGERLGVLTPSQAARMRNVAMIAPFVSQTFVVTPQAGFPKIRVAGRRVRVDALLWVPMRPDVRIVLECDGYEWHSDRHTFTTDRQRDRALRDAGYEVLRYSGSEIHQNPIAAASDLFDRLLRRTETWGPLELTEPPDDDADGAPTGADTTEREGPA